MCECEGVIVVKIIRWALKLCRKAYNKVIPYTDAR